MIKNNTKNLLLIIPLLILTFISVFTMYKCSLINNIYKANFIKQIIWYILFFIIIIININSKKYFKYAYLFYILNIILLILVLFIGTNINGARAWFKIGFISFQPSELMKLSYSIAITKLLKDYKHTTIKKEIILLLKIIILFSIPSILIFLEPDTGAIIFLFIITICMLFHSNINKIWLYLLITISIVLVSIFFYLYYNDTELLMNLIGTSFFYRMDRIINFNNNMQLNNSLISIGNGYLFGTNNYIYIPESSTDFAYSIAINTFGFIGSIIISLCYILLDYYFINKIYSTKNKTTKLFISGFIGILIFSELYNILMNIGLLPIMGIPLPFISYGGSNLIILAIYINIIFNTNKV